MKLSVANDTRKDSDVIVIGYADVVAIYDSAPVGSEAWDVADSWLRYLQLRSDAGRLLLSARRWRCEKSEARCVEADPSSAETCAGIRGWVAFGPSCMG